MSLQQYLRSVRLVFAGSDDARDVTDLRVAFEITKSMRSYPNLAKIDLYNPNEDTVNYIRARDPLVLLYAGYRDNARLIFKGRIRNLFVNKKGVDRIVIIYAGDGDRDWQRARYNKTLGGNVSLKDTVLDIFQSFISDDVSVGPVEGLTTIADKLLGQTLSGSSKDIMDGLANDYGFEWSIQDGELTTQQLDAPLTSQTAVLINQTTGMVGSPTITEIGADATTLLNPDLLPGRAFRIEADSQDVALPNLQFRRLKRTAATGLYRAYEVMFIGDTRGPSWLAKVKGTFLQ